MATIHAISVRKAQADATIAAQLALIVTATGITPPTAPTVPSKKSMPNREDWDAMKVAEYNAALLTLLAVWCEANN